MDDQDVEAVASRLAMLLLGHLENLDQAGLARVSRTAASQISLYWRGERPVPRKVLERIAEGTDFSQDLLAPLHWHLRSFIVASRGRSRADRILATGFATELIVVLGLAEDLILEPVKRVTGPGAPERDEAEALWEQLRQLSASERLLVVEEGAEYQSWALCERVTAASRELAPNQPRQALETAQLAVRIAELAPGDIAQRHRLQGWALFHVVNGHRACQDLDAARKAYSLAQELWTKSASGDPGLLNAAVPLWIEAVLRRSEREFPEALEKIDEALALEQGPLRAQMLLSKSAIFHALGQPQGSAAALAEAAPLIDPDREPHHALGLRFNLVEDLVHLGDFDQAVARLKEVQELADGLGEVLQLQRVTWLRGKVAAGLGQNAAAEDAFQQVRSFFQEQELAYDYALVSLDLSLVLLEEGRAGEVRQIAEEMVWIFDALKIQREALAALQLFCKAAQAEAATAELTRRVVQFLERSQHDPELKFEGNGKAGAG